MKFGSIARARLLLILNLAGGAACGVAESESTAPSEAAATSAQDTLAGHYLLRHGDGEAVDNALFNDLVLDANGAFSREIVGAICEPQIQECANGPRSGEWKSVEQTGKKFIEFHTCIARCSTGVKPSLIDRFEYSLKTTIDEVSELTLTKVGGDARLTFIRAANPTALRDAKNTRIRIVGISLGGVGDSHGLLNVSIDGCFDLDSVNKSLKATFAFITDSGEVRSNSAEAIVKDRGGIGGGPRGCHGPEWAFRPIVPLDQRVGNGRVTIEEGNAQIVVDIKRPFAQRRVEFASPADGVMARGATVRMLWPTPSDLIEQGERMPGLDLLLADQTSAFQAKVLAVEPSAAGSILTFQVPGDARPGKGRIRMGVTASLGCEAKANFTNQEVPCDRDPAFFAVGVEGEVR